MPSQTRKITLDTAALFFGRGVGLLLGIVRLNYLATYLGVANFGILNFATYFTALFQSLFDLGMGQLMTREISRNPGNSNDLLGRAVLLKILIVFIASLLVGVATLVSGFDSTTNWAIVLTTVTLSINGISTLFLSAFQAHRKMVIVSVANIVNDAIISAAVILILPQIASVSIVLGLTAIVSLINLAILVRLYYKLIGKPDYRVDSGSWGMMVKEGTPIAVSSLGISVYTFIGPTILRYTKGETEVGLFSAGYKLISILTLIPATFSQIVYPIFSDFYTNATHKLEKALQDSLRIMSEVSIPLAVGGVLLAPHIFAMLYPSSFEDGAFVFQAIIVGNALGYLAQVLYTFLLATNRHRTCMLVTVIVGIVVASASLIVVPRFGYQSVAIIFMLTDVTLFFTLLILTVAPGKFRAKFPKLFRILGASAMMGGVLFFVRDWYLVPIIAVAIILYFAFLFFFKTFGDQEKEIVSKIRREILHAQH